MAMSIPIPEKLVMLFSETVLPILKTEADKLRNVPSLVEGIKNEMENAKCSLKKAEKKAELADDVKKRIHKLRGLVFKIEDIVDDYELLLQEETYLTNNSDNSNTNMRCIVGIWNELERGCKAIIYFKSKHRIASCIVRIRNAIAEIKGGERGYEKWIFNVEGEDVKEKERERERDPGVYPLFKDEDELEGVSSRKKEVIKLLCLEGENNKEGQCVVAVWGEPGVGKTTLARKVYEDESVRKHFCVYAWITATIPYKKVDLLKSLFKQFIMPSTLNDSTQSDYIDSLPDNEVVVTDELRSYMKNQQHRYMVVVDDVSEKGELLKLIKAALVASLGKGCRILITTNSEAISNYWKISSSFGSTYNLQVLSEEESKTLFNKLAFGRHGSCPSRLTKLRDKIVEQCDGLPFLIEKVAETFSTSDKWIELCHAFQSNPLPEEHLKADSFNAPLPVRSRKDDLLLSYHEIPDHLKPCFLYLCMFPKGYTLKRMRIVRLWIAEGFVKERWHNTLEDVAEEYLNELVERGMVRLVKKDETGRNRKFRLQKMWHHIMLPLLEDLSFCQVLPDQMSLRKNQCRRLSIQSDIEDTAISPNIRSILSFVQPEVFPIIWANPFEKAELRLKILDLQNAAFNYVSKVIGNLHNLRYLCLRNTKISKLPESIIDGLWNLQTLDLKQTYVTELPKSIDRLSKLRHLLVCRYVVADNPVPMKLPDGVLKNFKELQKLAYVDGGSASLLQDLGHLTQLRRLAICELSENHGKDLCKALDGMKELRSLSLNTMNINEALDLTHVGYPPKLLERVYLEGALKGHQLPDWISKLKHMVKLRLNCSGFTTNPLAKLKRHPELLVLELDGYEGKGLDFGEGGLKKLQVLHLVKLHNLESIKAGTDTLPKLRTALYRDCPNIKLNTVPLPLQIQRVLKEALSSRG